MSGEELKAARGLTEEDRIRHDERKKIIAQGCIHSRKATEQDGNGNRADIVQWQRDQSEWFDPTICEIVSEYAAWRDARPLPEQPQEGEHIADAGKMVATHPNTDQGMTAGSIGEQAAAIRVALYRAVPNMPSYPVGIVEPVLEQFRLSSTAALEAEVERWHDAYCIAHDQAMSNGEAYQDAAAQIASLKQRLESAEGLLKTAYDAGIYLEPVAKGIATFLQEQEKQNG